MGNKSSHGKRTELSPSLVSLWCLTEIGGGYTDLSEFVSVKLKHCGCHLAVLAVNVNVGVLLLKAGYKQSVLITHCQEMKESLSS